MRGLWSIPGKRSCRECPGSRSGPVSGAVTWTRWSFPRGGSADRAGQFSRWTLLQGICSSWGGAGGPRLSVLPPGPGPSSSLAHCRTGLGGGAPLNSWTLGLGRAHEPRWAREHAVLGPPHQAGRGHWTLLLPDLPCPCVPPPPGGQVSFLGVPGPKLPQRSPHPAAAAWTDGWLCHPHP